MRTVVRTALFAAAVAAAGCGDSSSPARTEPAPKGTPAEPAAARVEVLPVSYAGLDRAIKEQKGKVVLVDVWSLT